MSFTHDIHRHCSCSHAQMLLTDPLGVRWLAEVMCAPAWRSRIIESAEGSHSWLGMPPLSYSGHPCHLPDSRYIQYTVHHNRTACGCLTSHYGHGPHFIRWVLKTCCPPPPWPSGYGDVEAMWKLWRRDVVSSSPDRGTIVGRVF